MQKVKLNLSLSEEVARWLKVKAAEQGMTVSELIEEWAKERMGDYGNIFGTDDVRHCIYCGRALRGYGSICDDCKAEAEAVDRERMAELWRKAKEELELLIEKWNKERNL